MDFAFYLQVILFIRTGWMKAREFETRCVVAVEALTIFMPIWENWRSNNIWCFKFHHVRPLPQRSDSNTHRIKHQCEGVIDDKGII